MNQISKLIALAVLSLAFCAPTFAEGHGGGGGHGGYGRGGYGAHYGYGGRGYGYGHYGWGGGWRGGWGWGWYGAFVPFLPLGYYTYWWDGVPYYYANNSYYIWNGDAGAYQVVAPPAGGAPPTPPAQANSELFAYPKNGQSAEVQARDRYECHKWASGQSGYDPTQASATTQPTGHANYARAEAACLESRGYTVK